MASYRLEFKPSVKKDLRAIPNHDVERLLRAIGNLAKQPHPPGSRKLTGREAWRLRLGKYRIIYTVEEERVTIVIVKVGHRGNVYR